MVVHAAVLAGGLGVSHMHRRARDGHAMGTAGVRSYGDHRLLDLLAEVLFGPARSEYSRRVHWVLTPGYSSALRRTCECRYAIANIRRRRSPGADAAGVGPVLGQMWIEPRPEEGPPSPPLRAPDPKVNTLAVFYGPMSTSKAVVP